MTLLTGGHKQEVELRPTGDELEATGPFRIGPETKAETGVADGSKSPLTARLRFK